MRMIKRILFLLATVVLLAACSTKVKSGMGDQRGDAGQ